jgi:hypothetical protein
MDEFVTRIISTLGVPGLSIYLAYRLLNTYSARLVEHAGRYVDATVRQAQATTELVAAVQAQGDGMKDVGMALRVLSSKIDDVSAWVKEIDTRTGGKPERKASAAA